ncbi:Putative large-conductance mechanosensitive channel [Candidatus Phytoplasma australiense]|uniref:Large-conductance mechanosensitive channel n=2 Tax=Phytoplasma australiense TaxID=59748 RepID=B1V916_PHYAS|nr:large conductance mechanosensitive channel protein MscL [Candidatus Phytoplasma australiense]AGL90722.1 Large-conductance mechanosensitive channel [Strawberry lethal yellows phytoplasma (CPA) str. NZSb11]CAM11448.1 Putative large-conductance mechanosensitive channel [Candidatus Phytoplasma australiense]
MTFFQGFKNFITRGNVINLAVAVVIGQLFSKIVSSLVADIMMPPFSLLFNETKGLQGLKWCIKEDVYMNYGIFLQNILEFVIFSFAIYLILTIFSRTKLEKPKSELKLILESLQKEITLLQEIKNNLQQNNNKK